MRWTPITTALLLTTVLAGPTLAQEGHAAMDHQMEIERHATMKMAGPMPGMLIEHAAPLGLTADQTARLEPLDARLATEMERHRAEMESIHEAAIEILTPEQREQVGTMMESMHRERAHGEEKAHEMEMDMDMEHEEHEDN